MIITINFIIVGACIFINLGGLRPIIGKSIMNTKLHNFIDIRFKPLKITALDCSALTAYKHNLISHS